MREAYHRKEEQSIHRALEKSQKKEKIRITNTILLIICIIVCTSTALSNGYGPANEMSCLIKKVHNPTFTEMLVFIAIDKTDQHIYTNDYVCHHFTKDVIANARQMGIQAGYVTLHNKPNGHAIVAFKTIDQGVYFVEPQTDKICTEAEMKKMVSEQFYRDDPQNPDGIPFKRYSINWFYGA